MKVIELADYREDGKHSLVLINYRLALEQKAHEEYLRKLSIKKHNDRVLKEFRIDYKRSSD